MAKEIEYKKKITNANTQYVKLKLTDKKYILDELNQLSQILDQLNDTYYSGNNQSIIKELYEQFNNPNKQLPKHTDNNYKHNSVYSFVSGLLHNLSTNQRDLTLKNIQALEYIINEFYYLNFKSCLSKVVFIEKS